MKETLEDSVTRHLIADRPVGIFLSGGVDSGAVAHLAARHGRARCLTMIFPEAEDDEGPAAARVAAELGVEHLQVPIRGVEIAEDLGAILASMDQPTSDGVNTWLVARAAHDAGLIVALSGLGGDELFGGYPSFRIVPRLASITRTLAPVPVWMREKVAGALTDRRPGSRLVRALSVSNGYGSAYAAFRGLHSSRELRHHGVRLPLPEDPPSVDHDLEPVDQVTLLEMTNYLPNQLLRDTDQMSMAHSLEVRVPLLDDEVVKAALALPGKIRAAKGKHLLAAASGERNHPQSARSRHRSSGGSPGH